jgi:endonuclease YncB( thermonuclease family)
MRAFLSFLAISSAFYALVFWLNASPAYEVENAAPVLPIPIRVLEVKDGDTISADLLLPWDVTLRDQDIRESTYDAWEASKRRRSVAAGEITGEEVEKGIAATAALKALLEGSRVFLEPSNRTRQDQGQLGDKLGERDNYGRVLGKLWVARGGKWIDVGTEMKRGGHLRNMPQSPSP